MKSFRTLLIACMAGMLLAGMFSIARSASSTYEKSYLGGTVKFRIDKSNVEQYKDKLALGVYRLVKEWGYVVPVYDTVHDYTFPKEYIEATAKYKGTPRINKQGGLENYTAGLPFPDPKSGAEVMWNYEYKYSGDDFFWTQYDIDAISTTGKKKKLIGYYRRLAYQGRVKETPMPSIPNADGIAVKEIQGISYPEDLAGLALLTARYQNATKGDDGWMYIPTIRRVRRISVAQRGDTFGGTDFTWDDYRTFSGKVSDYNWTLVGKKEMYMAYHILSNNPKYTGKIPAPDDLRYELKEVYVVDGVNKDKDYVYGKRRVYVDADSFAVCSNDLWDRRGQLWKYNESGLTVKKHDHVMFNYYQNMFDLIAKRGSMAYNAVLKTNIGQKESDFTTTRLQSQSR
jgi:hypothetical protein